MPTAISAHANGHLGLIAREWNGLYPRGSMFLHKPGEKIHLINNVLSPEAKESIEGVDHTETASLKGSQIAMQVLRVTY